MGMRETKFELLRIEGEKTNRTKLQKYSKYFVKLLTHKSIRLVLAGFSGGTWVNE